MSSLDPSTGLTCVTCQLVFKTPELQKEHYRTDWHRYNMKRQVAELPPVTDEQFRSKVLTYRADKQEAEKDESEALFCKVCRKQLKSKNAFENHIASKKHKDTEKEAESETKKGPRQPKKIVKEVPTPTTTEAAADVEMKEEEDDDDDDGDSSGWETDNGSEDGDYDYDENQAVPSTTCLFCPQTKPTKAERLEHMRFHHGFVLPDQQYLVDEDGMLQYLSLKVGAGRVCLYCPDIKGRYATIDACKMHMRDKAHCKVAHELKDMLEYAEYYDYTPMYESEQEKETDVLYDDGWTLTLPSGAKIGHRSLMVYYRQYCRPGETLRKLNGRQLESAKGLVPALAWTNTTGQSAKQVAKDLKYIDKYRRRFDVRWKSCSNKKAHILYKTGGRVGDNRM